MDEAPMEDAGNTSAQASVPGASSSDGDRQRVIDATGRRLKGRGAGGSSATTMGDGGSYEAVSTKSNGLGPAKCARALAPVALPTPLLYLQYPLTATHGLILRISILQRSRGGSSL